MNIPDYQTVMLPVLQIATTEDELSTRELTNRVSDRYDLSEEERRAKLPSGQMSYIANRVGWAKTYLKKAGLLEQPKRGVIRITEEGKSVLSQNLERIDNKFLEQYPSYLEFRDKKKEEKATTEQSTEEPDSSQTPEELLDASYETLHDVLADELLDQVKSCSSEFFERLVVKLLVEMGYGGSIEDAGRAIGKVGDGGIDGIIKEDKLGLDVIVIQAKKWGNSTVGRPEVQAFAGSMEPHRAKKGVFITTSTFSKEAHDYVTKIERSIVLIDGPRLANLMIEHNVGISPSRTFVLKKLDQDYFEE